MMNVDTKKEWIKKARRIFEVFLAKMCISNLQIHQHISTSLCIFNSIFNSAHDLENYMQSIIEY